MTMENQTVKINQISSSNVKMKVFGVGGAGNNIIDSMYAQGFKNLEFVLFNTDTQQLNHKNPQIRKIAIGSKLTNGFGAGSDAKIGQKAAFESKDLIREIIGDADLVFTVFGIGGGTGTGAGPEIAKMAKEAGALSIVLTTIPFDYEGAKKKQLSKEIVSQLKNFCDSYVLFSNEKLLSIYGNSHIDECFDKINSQIQKSIATVVDLITETGIQNIDFADVRTILKEGGHTIIGSDIGPSDDLDLIIQNAVESPLFEGTLRGCKDVIIQMLYGKKTRFNAGQQIVSKIQSIAMNDEIDVRFGIATNESLNDEVKVSIIATSTDEYKFSEEEQIANQEPPFAEKKAITAFEEAEDGTLADLDAFQKELQENWGNQEGAANQFEDTQELALNPAIFEKEGKEQE